MTKEEIQYKPVAWGMETDGLIYDVICPAEHEREEGEYTIPLYTHPKKWVRLTEKQIDKLEKEFIGFPVPNIYNFVQAIEAKLKEKNT